MAQAVVVGLEVVDIHQQQRQRGLVTRSAAQFLFDMIVEGSREVKNLKYHLEKDSKALQLLYKEFESRNGENSLPVQNM